MLLASRTILRYKMRVKRAKKSCSGLHSNGNREFSTSLEQYVCTYPELNRDLKLRKLLLYPIKL